MSRPLIQKRVDELEAMFEKEQGDPAALRLIETELSFRTVPRATSLLVKVRRVLGGGVVEPTPKQDTLFESKPARPVQSTLISPEPQAASPAPQVQMSVEDAQKFLKVSAGTVWEAVEESRRQIVEKARPDRLANVSEDKRVAAREDARRANAAYRVLSETRRA